MAHDTSIRVGLLYRGDREARLSTSLESGRFANLYQAFAAKGIQAEPAVYDEDFSQEVREQLLGLDGVLVWVDPIQGGRDRSDLDAMLRDVAAAGIFVSTHPDVILKLGTKEVLYTTRGLGWGSDTHLYASADQLAQELPARLAAGKARVLKQYRGSGGNGVWKVELPAEAAAGTRPGPGALLRVRHARRGCTEEEVTLGEFLSRCEGYFAGTGRMIDQEYQERLPEGMIRCYLVHDKVAGFGHQAVNALYPAPPGAPPTEAPPPGPRLYYPPTKPEFQALKHILEHQWVPEAQRVLGIDTESLPVLWDCDFLLGPETATGEDTYVLCEINVSGIYPYPESVVAHVAEAMAARIRAAGPAPLARRGRRETCS